MYIRLLLLAVILLISFPTVTSAVTTLVEDVTLTTWARTVEKNAICGTGVCFNLTSACPVGTVFTRAFSRGATGLDVVSLQDFLVRGRYLTIPQNTMYGTFGPTTSNALSRYQRAVGLSATGIVDEATRVYLNDSFLKKGTCFAHYRADILDLQVARTASTSILVEDLNASGYKSTAGQPFCYTQKANCMLLTRGKAFTMFVPQGLGIVRTATYFKASSDIFSVVSYVKTKVGDIFLTQATRTTTYREAASSTSNRQVFTYTATSSTGQVTVADEYRAILESNFPISDRRLFGTWSLSKSQNSAYLGDVYGPVTLTVTEADKKIRVEGCGTMTGEYILSFNVLKILLPKVELSQCTNSRRVSAQGDIQNGFRDGIKYQIKDSSTLVLISSAGVELEFKKI